MAIDDYSPTPIAPSFAPDADEIQEQMLDNEDKKLAQAYHHPAWSAVEEIFDSVLVQFSTKPNSALPAEEYKIKSLADEQSAAAIKAIWIRITDAVDATDGQRTVTGE